MTLSGMCEVFVIYIRMQQNEALLVLGEFYFGL